MADNLTIGPELARSWLLVNALHTERYSHVGHADVVVLDIEDAVAPGHKETARQNVVDHLSQEGNRAWVRINGFGTEWWEADCKALAGLPGLEGIFLAMVESPEHVIRTSELVEDAKIVALVETARGIQQLGDIAASRNTFRLAFGLGDYRRDTGFDDDPMTLAYTRSQFTIASRAAGLPGPIDGPAVGATGVALADSAGITTQFGMTGKICLMPEQTAIVNEILSPGVGEMSWALDFLAEFNQAGGEIRNGSDLPRLARANKILDLAKSFGLPLPEGYHHFTAPTDTYHH